MIFKNRTEAGKRVAEHLMHYAHRGDTLVLGLARGGVPVALEVARALDLALDVFVVRKLGVPGHAELAMGAVAPDEVTILNDELIDELAISSDAVSAVIASETIELNRRAQAYRKSRPALSVKNHTVILIDDGLATGATMRAAIAAPRKQRVGRLVVAVPVGAPSTCDEISPAVDELICVSMPEPFYGVSRWYEDFSQTSDGEVLHLLEQSQQNRVEQSLDN